MSGEKLTTSCRLWVVAKTCRQRVAVDPQLAEGAVGEYLAVSAQRLDVRSSPQLASVARSSESESVEQAEREP
jgi:hypothetical protein